MELFCVGSDNTQWGKKGRGGVLSEESRRIWLLHSTFIRFYSSLSLLIYFCLQRYFSFAIDLFKVTHHVFSISPSCVTTFRMSRHRNRVSEDYSINTLKFASSVSWKENKRKEKKLCIYNKVIVIRNFQRGCVWESTLEVVVLIRTEKVQHRDR